MIEDNYILYQHISPSGKIYIGITKNSDNPNKRWINGKGYKKQPRFYNAIKYYGWNSFKHEIIYNELSKEEACRRERILIRLYNTTNKNFGYNIADGGECGNSLAGKTEEEIAEIGRKISKANKGKFTGENNYFYNKHFIGKENPMYGKTGENAPFYGKKHSKETKQKMSEIKTGENNPNYGKIFSEEHKRRLSELLSGGNSPNARKIICITTGEIFATAKDGGKKYGVDNSSIGKCCKRKKKSAGKNPSTGEKMIWMYYEDYLLQKDVS